jgi:hypothetical protein
MHCSIMRNATIILSEYDYILRTTTGCATMISRFSFRMIRYHHGTTVRGVGFTTLFSNYRIQTRTKRQVESKTLLSRQTPTMETFAIIHFPNLSVAHVNTHSCVHSANIHASHQEQVNHSILVNLHRQDIW